MCFINELKNINDLHLIKKKKYSKNSYHQFVIRTSKRDILKKVKRDNTIGYKIFKKEVQ